MNLSASHCLECRARITTSSMSQSRHPQPWNAPFSQQPPIWRLRLPPIIRTFRPTQWFQSAWGLHLGAMRWSRYHWTSIHHRRRSTSSWLWRATCKECIKTSSMWGSSSSRPCTCRSSRNKGKSYRLKSSTSTREASTCMRWSKLWQYYWSSSVRSSCSAK